jgi:diadenosine tetraphosphate (Ap4A) HIT family hydrolase
LAPDDVERAFRDKFRLDALTVHETDAWTLSVRPAQPVLGALVLSTRHRALDFSQLPGGAGTTMVEMMAHAERAACALFGAVRLNALCLMMQDPLFHFHLLPRYHAPVDFAGATWRDPGWPGPPTLGENQASEDAQLYEIRRAYATRVRP